MLSSSDNLLQSAAAQLMLGFPVAAKLDRVEGCTLPKIRACITPSLLWEDLRGKAFPSLSMQCRKADAKTAKPLQRRLLSWQFCCLPRTFSLPSVLVSVGTPVLVSVGTRYGKPIKSSFKTQSPEPDLTM